MLSSTRKSENPFYAAAARVTFATTEKIASGELPRAAYEEFLEAPLCLLREVAKEMTGTVEGFENALRSVESATALLIAQAAAKK